MNKELQHIFGTLTSEKHYVPNTISDIDSGRKALNVTAGQNANWTYANFFILDTNSPITDYSINEGQYVVAFRDGEWGLWDFENSLVANGLKEIEAFVKKVSYADSLRLNYLSPQIEPINNGLLTNSLENVVNNTDERTKKLFSYLRAIRTKPFLLLAGISGTGKSRIVRQLARSVWPLDSSEHTGQKPSNFEMIQVKPNWHDSSELFGYVSRINDKPQFIAGDFIKFIAKAWENPDVPYFLCLDEMNLAPVEQYFAEYLSVLESRKLQVGGKIVTDPILKKTNDEWYYPLIASITTEKLDPEVKKDFLTYGIRIPPNLIVVGTVNMDETTYSFSRKVLDRAMTIEMNDVDLNGGLYKSDDIMPYIPANHFLADAVEGYDIYERFEDECKTVIDYLGAVNGVLDKTPFKIAYRTRNEFLIYVVNALRLTPEDAKDTDAKRNEIIAKALDEVTSMKILSRIEGDKRKVHFLEDLKNTIKSKLEGIDGIDRTEGQSISLAKLKIMGERLKSGYTSFWD